MDSVKTILRDVLCDVASLDGAWQCGLDTEALLKEVCADRAAWGRILACAGAPEDETLRIVRAEVGKAFGRLHEERRKKGLKQLDNRLRYVIRRYHDLFKTLVIDGRIHVRVDGYPARPPPGPGPNDCEDDMPPPLVSGQHSSLFPWSAWMAKVLRLYGGPVEISTLVRMLWERGRVSPGGTPR
jgi:hypothetical protein